MANRPEGREEHLMSDQEFRDYVAANYDRFLTFVQSYTRPPLEAADLLQQALLGLWCRRTVITGKPDGYFFQSLRHIIVSAWRSRGRDPRPLLSAEGLTASASPVDEADSPGHVLNSGSLVMAIGNCINQATGATPENITTLENACRETFRRLRSRMVPPQPEVFAAYLQSGGNQRHAQSLLNLPSPSSYPNALHKAKVLIRQVLAPNRQALVQILGAVRVRELLVHSFCEETKGL
jgi:DNA-directed RNA polymerase specialized sigma24 family protein